MLQNRILSLFGISAALVSAAIIPQAMASKSSCTQEKTCSEIAQRALQASRDKDWQGARTLYEQAYRQVPEPELLLNIGRCWHKLGQCDRAKKQYLLYRAQVPQPASDVMETLQRFEQEADSTCQASPNQQTADAVRPTWRSAQLTALGSPTLEASEQSPLKAPSVVTNASASSFGLHKKWWFWTLLGTAAASGAVGLAVGLAPRQPASSTQQEPSAGPIFSLTFEPKR